MKVIINQLDKHSVAITVLNSSMGKSYTGSWCGLALPYVGLEEGVLNTYYTIKHSYDK